MKYYSSLTHTFNAKFELLKHESICSNNSQQTLISQKEARILCGRLNEYINEYKVKAAEQPHLNQRENPITELFKLTYTSYNPNLVEQGSTIQFTFYIKPLIAKDDDDITSEDEQSVTLKDICNHWLVKALLSSEITDQGKQPASEACIDLHNTMTHTRGKAHTTIQKYFNTDLAANSDNTDLIGAIIERNLIDINILEDRHANPEWRHCWMLIIPEITILEDLNYAMDMQKMYSDHHKATHKTPALPASGFSSIIQRIANRPSWLNSLAKGACITAFILSLPTSVVAFATGAFAIYSSSILVSNFKMDCRDSFNALETHIGFVVEREEGIYGFYQGSEELMQGLKQLSTQSSALLLSTEALNQAQQKHLMVALNATLSTTQRAITANATGYIGALNNISSMLNSLLYKTTALASLITPIQEQIAQISNSSTEFLTQNSLQPSINSTLVQLNEALHSEFPSYKSSLSNEADELTMYLNMIGAALLLIAIGEGVYWLWSAHKYLANKHTKQTPAELAPTLNQIEEMD